jgi:2-polyprenyl-6-methoxyphenol hydroxylase-like FAD-dependent oxidoreductase
MIDVDVLVVGGGPAGVTAAAGLSAQGKSVLLVDAGLDRSKVLAGELLHPSALDDLRRVGLGAALESLHGRDVVGFAVMDAAREAVLAYPQGERGLSVEHAPLVEALFRGLGGRPGVTVWTKARVSSISRNDDTGVEARVARGNEETQVRARLYVAADGRASASRKLLGIDERHERMSTMVGITVEERLLPHPLHGHIFVGGPAPILAYGIGEGLARVMADVPLGSTAATLKEEPRWLSGLPQSLREAVVARLTPDQVRIASNDTRVPEVLLRNSAVLVGDASGCCHPVSASGIASGVHDAVTLVDALGADRQQSAALERFVRARRPAQRTRIALASALYRAFADRGPEMDALRAGLFDYWQTSPRGTAASMSLLSTREPRMWVMAREYAAVVGHGLKSLGQGGGAAWRARAGTGLLASALPHLKTAAEGLVEDLEARLGS